MNIYFVSVLTHGYDEYDSHVVFAETPSIARKVAQTKVGDEGQEPWKTAKVKLIGVATNRKTRGIILSSFNAG